MNRGEILRMAREAGLLPNYEVYEDDLERFAALVAAHTLANIDPSKFMPHRESFKAGAAAEREACAEVAEEYLDDPVLSGQGYATGCARAIRERGGER